MGYATKVKNILGFGRKRDLKGIFVVIDGLGDLPCKVFNGKTPLEEANTPNLDFLATRGKLGYMYPIKPAFIPESDESLVSLFGNKSFVNLRGQLEAKGLGVDLKRGDLAIRINWATINPETKEIIDRRAGRTLTDKEKKELLRSLEKIKVSSKFKILQGNFHSSVLIFEGGFSENVSMNDKLYVQGKINSQEKVLPIRPLDESEMAQYTSNILNEFLEQAHEILKNHPVNLKRKQKGFYPANYLLIRDAGIELPKFKLYRNWFSTAYSPLQKGFAKASGMKTFDFDFPKFKSSDFYVDAYLTLKKAIKFTISKLKEFSFSYSYAYVHIGEIDIPGHDNKPLEKKSMIEYLDSTLFLFLRNFAPPNNLKIIVTSTYSTPCKLKTHSADPVPVLLYDNSIPREKTFCEKQARVGSLGRIIGNELLKKLEFF